MSCSGKFSTSAQYRSKFQLLLYIDWKLRTDRAQAGNGPARERLV